MDMMTNFIEFTLSTIFEEETKRGKTVSEIITNLVKGEDKDAEIAANYERVFKKTPSQKQIELDRWQTKLHALEIFSRDDIFEKSEDKRYELANCMIELANELKTIKGDTSE